MSRSTQNSFIDGSMFTSTAAGSEENPVLKDLERKIGAFFTDTSQ